MALVDRARLRAMLMQATGDYASLTNTGTSSSAVTDADIARWDTGHWTDRWTYITSGNRVGESRRNASISSTTATLVTALSGALANGDTFEFLWYDPDIIHRAIEEACRTIWPKPPTPGRSPRGLYKAQVGYVIVDNLLDDFYFEQSESTGAITAFATYDSTIEGATLVTDAGHGLSTGDTITISGTTNYNGTFQIVVVSSSTFYIMTPFIADDATGTWREGYSSQAGTASGWTATSGTWTFPAGLRRKLGRHAATATGAATLTQNIFTKVNVHEAAGKTIHVRGWVWSSTASIGRLRISFDGGSTFAQSSSYHTGNSDWQLLDFDVAIPTTATTITIYCDVASGGSAYFDVVHAWIDPVAEYDLPYAFGDRAPHLCEQQVDEDYPEGTYLSLHRYATSGRLLKLTANVPLNAPTQDVGAVEIEEYQAELLIAETAMHMFRMLKNAEPQRRAEYEANERDWERKANEMRASLGKGFTGGDYSDWWRVSEDSPRRLVLPR